MKDSLWMIIPFLSILCHLVVLSWAEKINSNKELEPPCDSQIYCTGPLLKTVQLAAIFNDSKSFVDMPMVNSPNITLENFYKLLQESNNNPSKDQIKKFVDTNFLPPGSEFVPWDPIDFNPEPSFLKDIKDKELAKFGKDLVQVWKVLGRQISDEVFENPDKHSLICLPHPVIVPGGRFREIYYWDSYWTIDGLLLSEMRTTAKGMLDNFIQLVRQYGFVPNGGRVYYTRRSQPPYLISMVQLYLEETGDLDFVKENIDFLEKEFLFWEENRLTEVKDPKSGKTYKVNQYNVQVSGPRPESYKEDYNLASSLPNEKESEELYIDIKSAAESGHDFSTRWFVTGDTNEGDLSDLKTTSIIPVDLNSLLCRNARLLSKFYKKLGNDSKAEEYQDLYYAKKRTMAELFWDEVDGIWHDLTLDGLSKRRYFYLSDFHPLWSGCYGLEGKREDTVKRVINYLKQSKTLDYIGGLPTSVYNSGQQWDFPNAWAPLQYTVAVGLYNARSLNSEAEEIAFDISQEFVRTVYTGFLETDGAVFEKYNVSEIGVAGEGGEYDVQVGFGWTNGVVMRMMKTFGDRISASQTEATEIRSGKLVYPKY